MFRAWFEIVLARNVDLLDNNLRCGQAGHGDVLAVLHSETVY